MCLYEFEQIKSKHVIWEKIHEWRSAAHFKQLTPEHDAARWMPVREFAIVTPGSWLTVLF